MKDGGPAFPINGQYQEILSLRGMSLRDYFAAKALPTIDPTHEAPWRGAGVSSAERLARECYEIADAMLSERDK